MNAPKRAKFEWECECNPYAGICWKLYSNQKGHCPHLPGDDNKRDPERENLAVLTIAAQTANVIHIRVMFNAITRYITEREGGIGTN